MRLLGQCFGRGGTLSFVLERAKSASTATPRWLLTAPALLAVARGAPARFLRRGAGFRQRQGDPRSSRFRKSDGNRLLRRARTVFALSHVMDLFANELSRLGGRRLSLLLGGSSPFLGLLFRHGSLLLACGSEWTGRAKQGRCQAEARRSARRRGRLRVVLGARSTVSGARTRARAYPTAPSGSAACAARHPNPLHIGPGFRQSSTGVVAHAENPC